MAFLRGGSAGVAALLESWGQQPAAAQAGVGSSDHESAQGEGQAAAAQAPAAPFHSCRVCGWQGQSMQHFNVSRMLLHAILCCIACT